MFLAETSFMSTGIHKILHRILQGSSKSISGSIMDSYTLW